MSGKDGKAIHVKPGSVSGLRVHLGAGPINLQGWVNIDAREAPHIHLIANNFDLVEFADGTVAEIYLCHVLEHFSFEESEQLLRNFRKKLKPGATLRISVPDFDHLVAIYQANSNNLEIVKRALMGGQDYEYNFHKSIYNKALLSRLMLACGYANPQEWTTAGEFGADLGDWSNKNFDTPAGSFPVSLNIKAVVAGT
ncbi:methyltransferase [Rhizobium leguminosarum]|uniref:class I SAM-dependent methyltransferase n=1 Tax=Rhizobium leguminosarum TaxID=384 RepID=UPI0010310CA4|nr:methyltransferase [Rhizobium leguminosarum]